MNVLSLPFTPAATALAAQPLDESTAPRPNRRAAEITALGGRPGSGSEGNFDPGDAPPINQTLSATTNATVAAASSCSVFIDTTEPATSNWCTQEWINFYWNAYDFTKDNFIGEGWHDPCNVNKPLGRVFNAIDLVIYASPDAAGYTGDFSGPFLRWGGNYTIREIDEVLRGCFGSPASEHAETTWGPLIDEETIFFHPSFQDNVVDRAGTLIHEARHASWCDHNGDCPAGGASCDESWNDGCAWPYGGMGANAYETVWLWWYAVGARPQLINARMKAFAIDTANIRLRLQFEHDPCFRLDSNGNSADIC